MTLRGLLSALRGGYGDGRHRPDTYHVRAGALVAAVLPTNALRCAAYRLLGYRVIASRIGLGTLIDVESAEISGSVIGPLNRFHGPFSLVVDGAEIGAFNEFTCGDWAPDWPCYMRYCRLHRGSFVTGNHVIDAAGGFELGEDSWIGGRRTEVWTHSGDDDPENDHLAVAIGDHCFVGSRCLFAPGSRLAPHTTVSMGSTVIGTFDEPRCLLGGVPAVVLRTDYEPLVRHSHSPAT